MFGESKKELIFSFVIAIIILFVLIAIGSMDWQSCASSNCNFYSANWLIFEKISSAFWLIVSTILFIIIMRKILSFIKNIYSPKEKVTKSKKTIKTRKTTKRKVSKK